jgi:hypothetical protein
MVFNAEVYMSLHSDTLSWFRDNRYLLLLLNLKLWINGEAANPNFTGIDELTIYRTWSEHANHYTTDAVQNLMIDKQNKRL